MLALPASARTISFRDGESPTTGYVGSRDTRIVDHGDLPWSPSVNYGKEVYVRSDSTARVQNGVFRFDVSAIPAGTTVSAVSLILNVTRGSTTNHAVHGLLRNWTDSTVTWNQASAGVPWTTRGGMSSGNDHEAAVVTQLHGPIGSTTFAFTAAGVALVQQWVDAAANNRGLIVLPAPVPSTDVLAWSSADHPTEDLRPRLVITLGSAAAGQTTVSFQNGRLPDTTYVGNTDATLANATDLRLTNYGAASLAVNGKLSVNGTGNQIAGINSTLLAFDLSAIPTYASVQSATLTLSATSASSVAYPLYELLRPWTEQSANYLNATATTAWATPGALGATDHDPTPLGTFTPNIIGTHTVTLNSAGLRTLNAWVSQQRPNHGWLFRNTATADISDFASREDVTLSLRPRLTVNYVDGELRFSPAGQSLAVNGISAPFVVQRRRLEGQPLNTGTSALTVTVQATGSMTGFSLQTETQNTWVNPMELTIPAGQDSTPPIFFRSASTGTIDVTVSAPGEWTTPLQQFLVGGVAGQPHHVELSGPLEAQACGELEVTATVMDGEGAPVAQDTSISLCPDPEGQATPLGSTLAEERISSGCIAGTLVGGTGSLLFETGDAPLVALVPSHPQLAGTPIPLTVTLTAAPAGSDCGRAVVPQGPGADPSDQQPSAPSASVRNQSALGWSCHTVPGKSSGASLGGWLLLGIPLLLRRRLSFGPLLTLALAVMLATGGTAEAARRRSQPPGNPFLSMAKRHLQESDYEKGLQALETARAHSKSLKERVEIELLDGVLSAELGNQPRAVRAFKMALGLSPKAKLPYGASTPVARLFDQTRSELLSRKGSRRAVPPSPPASERMMEKPAPPAAESAPEPTMAEQEPSSVRTRSAPLELTGDRPTTVVSTSEDRSSRAAGLLVGTFAIGDALGRSIGAGVDAGFHLSAFALSGRVLLGQKLGFGAQLDFIPWEMRLSPRLGGRFTALPGSGLGGGPVLGLSLRLFSGFHLDATTAVEFFNVPPPYRQLAWVSSVGLRFDTAKL